MNRWPNRAEVPLVAGKTVQMAKFFAPKTKRGNKQGFSRSLDKHGIEHIQPFALRHAFDDIHQHDIGQPAHQSIDQVSFTVYVRSDGLIGFLAPWRIVSIQTVFRRSSVS